MLQSAAYDGILSIINIEVGYSVGEFMIKRSFKVLSLVLIMLCLVSCGSDRAWVKIGEDKIDRGVYNYFLNEAENNEETAEYLCKKYLAAAELMKKENVSLSANSKMQAAEETEKLWSMFSAFYESIDVTKQDITKVKTYEGQKLELLRYYYGAGGKGEVGEEKLRQEFAKSYVGFKAIEASFLKLNDVGESVETAESEKKILRSKFKAMANKVNAGAHIDTVNESYNESIGLIVTGPLNLTVIKENDPIYGEEFFSDVSKLSYGEAAVIESGSSIYMIVKERIDNNDEIFSLYNDAVLQSLKMKSVEKKIEKMIK